MAPDCSSKRVGRSVGFYKDLESLHLPKAKRLRRTNIVLPRRYTVERIISRRVVSGVTEYLLKWQDWPLSAATWEPASHLPTALINTFDNPSPSSKRVESFTETLLDGIQSRLSSKSHTLAVSLLLAHDVFRYLFKSKGRPAPEYSRQVLLEKKDFEDCHLPDHWYYCFDCHGQGKAIFFPVRVKLHLRLSRKTYVLDGHGKVKPGPRKYIETITFFIARQQRGADNCT